MIKQNQAAQKCGFVSILGHANAGKSTLVNALVGQKVSIVCDKPHTTRYEIHGVLQHGSSQIVLVDTPGLISKPTNSLQSFMHKTTHRNAREADVYLFVLDATKPIDAQARRMLNHLKDKPLVVALNKVDKMNKLRLLPLAQQIQTWTKAIPMISALKHGGLEGLLAEIEALLPEGPWLYGGEDVSQISQRFWAAELTREQAFNALHQEIPYHLHVLTTKWKETKKDITIEQKIIVDQPHHKKWVLGYEGQRIRLIGESARHGLMAQLGKPVHLFLQVEVDKKWMSKIEMNPEGLMA